MSGSLSQKTYKDANKQRIKARNKKFDNFRKNQQQKEFEQLDYLHLYPKDIKQAIIYSLNGPIPQQLPPLDVTTISYYRRLNKPIYQTRIPGHSQLDLHMTHQSLHILSMSKQNEYPNFGGLTRQFQRDLKLYLSAPFEDIRTMALIAAGNHILGKQKDILIIAQGNINDQWVLFNHILTQKISYKALLPYIIKGYQVPLRALYQFSNISGHQAIFWFFDNPDVVDSLLNCIHSSDDEVQKLALRIIGNVLGQSEDEYAKILINSSFLDRMFKLLMSSDNILRKDACWTLANLCSHECIIANVLNSQVMGRLFDLLEYENRIEIKREIVQIFNYIVCYGDKQSTFRKLVNIQFLQMMEIYAQIDDNDLLTVVFNIILGLLVIGDQYKDENDNNMVMSMILNMNELKTSIMRGISSQNSLVSECCNNIEGYLKINNRMEGQI